MYVGARGDEGKKISGVLGGNRDFAGTYIVVCNTYVVMSDLIGKGYQKKVMSTQAHIELNIRGMS